MKIMKTKIFDGYMLDKVLNRIKEIIHIEKLDKTKTFIDANDKLSQDITFKNFVILVTCVTKDDNKLYQQFFRKIIVC